MSYFDMFVAAVPTASKQTYTAFAEKMDACFIEYGASAIADCWGDDVPEGEVTSFGKAVQCRDDETVVCGWIKWPSKAIRDEAWEKVMTDPRMQGDMPFDGKRMFFGGFETLVEK